MLFSPLPMPQPDSAPPSIPPRFSQENAAPAGGEVSRGDSFSPISSPKSLSTAGRWHLRGQGFRQTGETCSAASQALAKAAVCTRLAQNRTDAGSEAGPPRRLLSSPRAWERNPQTRLPAKQQGKGERSLTLRVAALSSPH